MHMFRQRGHVADSCGALWRQLRQGFMLSHGFGVLYNLLYTQLYKHLQRLGLDPQVVEPGPRKAIMYVISVSVHLLASGILGVIALISWFIYFFDAFSSH